MGIKGKDEPNIYRDVNQDYQTLGGEQQPQQTGGNDFDYYQALKDENYKSLLNNQVQLANARQQALKNTNVGLNAAGFGSAGYGALQRNGIESAYMQGLTQNQNDFATRNLDINKQQFDAEQNAMNENFQSLSTLMSGAESSSQLDMIMDRYGLNTDGNFDYEKAKQLYGEESAKQLDVLYNMYKDQYTNNSDEIPLRDYNLAISVITDNTGATGTMKDELQYLFAGKSGISPTDGTVVKVSDNGNDKHNCYLVWKNGTWYQTDAKTYAQSEDRYWLRSGTNNTKMQIDHNGQEQKQETMESKLKPTDSYTNQGYQIYEDEEGNKYYQIGKTNRWVQL